MLFHGEAGIDCGECGYQKLVSSQDAANKLMESLSWVGCDPICPDCGSIETFENYIDESPVSLDSETKNEDIK